MTSTLPPANGHAYDRDDAQRIVRDLLVAIGEDPDREGLRETPRRIASMYAELFEGLRQDPVAVLSVGFEEGHDELVILRESPSTRCASTISCRSTARLT